jgi:hypothetical protein
MRGRNQISYTSEQVSKWLKKRFPKVDWRPVISRLPPIIWRARWDELAEKLGLPYSRKHMQNLDCYGEGPGSIESNQKGDSNAKK